MNTRQDHNAPSAETIGPFGISSPNGSISCMAHPPRDGATSNTKRRGSTLVGCVLVRRVAVDDLSVNTVNRR